MKLCPKCEKTLPLEAFGKNSSKRDGLQGNCSSCNKKNNKDWYKRNSKTTIRKKKSARDAKLAWLAEYKKTLKCNRCPESFFRCLEFHHLDGSDKTATISVVARSWSLERLKKEIAKCEILCANCHRKETFRDEYMAVVA